MRSHKQLKKIAAGALTLMLSHAAQAESLTIVVNGIQEEKGEIQVALYDSAEAFDQGGAAALGILQPVTGKDVTVTIDGLEAGQYAIKLYHDADSDGEMDANMMGMPAERYGFSGESARRGPPLWQEAVFEVADGSDTEAVVELR